MKRAGRNGIKLTVAVAALAVSFVLLAGASFAWYVISTKAEAGDIAIVFKGLKWPFECGYQTTVPETNEDGSVVTDENGKTVYQVAWQKELNLTNYLKTTGLADCQLRPISTYDLQNWYIAKYNVDGDVSGFEEVSLSSVVNKSAKWVDVTDENGEVVGQVDNSTGSVVCIDLWVRETNDGEQAGLKLSTVEPRTTSDGYTYGDAIVDETVEGTYVLTKPSVNDDGSYAYVVKDGVYSMTEDDTNRDALNCLRIGFALMDADNNVVSYFIYEPNADRHNGNGTTTDYSKYILTDITNPDTAVQVKNFSKAIVLSGETSSRFYDYFSLLKDKDVYNTAGYNWLSSGALAPLISVSSSLNESTGVLTLSPGYRSNVVPTGLFSNGERIKITDASTGTSGESYDLLYTYVPTKVTKTDETTGEEVTSVELHPQQTVRQLGSDWDMSSVATKNPNTVNGSSLNSSDVKTFGQFVDETPVLGTIKNGEPMKLRIYIWLEGQDVDCWNDIAGASLFANLEFTGVEIAEIPEEEDS